MYKISLLLLAVSLPICAMLSPILQCAKRLPGAMISMQVEMQQSGTLVQQRRMLSDKTPFAEFIAQMKTEINKMDTNFLAQLKYKEPDLHKDSCHRERDAALSHRLRNIAARAFIFGPNDDDMVTSLHYGELSLVEHMLECGANRKAYDEWVRARSSRLDDAIWSVNIEAMRLLLEAGVASGDNKALIKLDFQKLRWVLGFSQQQDVFKDDGDAIKEVIEKEVGYNFYERYPTKNLTRKEQVEVLKKIMLLANIGAAPRFSFKVHPVRCPEYVFDTMYSDDLEGDWTHGRFTALADYFRNLFIFQGVCASWDKKEKARVAIEGIMKKYDIKEEDVTIVPKAESPRVQEAD